MSNLVIVAIPDENDRVWKVSSEKVPHLTLLFLGDSDKVSNLESIVQFVEHAASTTLKRFYLPVDRRDELGEDKADTLIFRKSRYDYKAVRDFRSVLLKDNNIKTAYDSATQHEGPWVPHLTLGYPASPAKPDDTDRDYGFYDVGFNKIAVWVDNYDGPEFLLKDYWEEFDALESVPMDVAMSGIMRHGADEHEQNLAMGSAFLAHYGKKGMRWGVQNTRQDVPSKVAGTHIRINKRDVAGLSASGSVAIAVAGPLAFLSPKVRVEMKAAQAHNKGVQADKKWTKEIAKSKRGVEVHNTAAKEMNEKLPGFNGDKRWKDKNGDIDLTSNPTKQKEYNDAVTKEVINPAYANAAAKVYGSSPTGRYKFEVHDAASATLRVKDTKDEVEHAAGDETMELRFRVIRNKLGHIVGLEPEDAEMVQSMDLGSEFLEHFASSEDAPTEYEKLVAEFLATIDIGDGVAHYGTKGMRWGVRREAPSAVDASGTSRVPHGSRRKTKIDVEGGQNHSAHEDAIVVAESKAKLKKSGVTALSNAELQKMAKRLQLETQVAQLTSSRGQKFIQRQLEQTGQNTFQTGVRTYGPAAVKKGAKKAGKVAATGAVGLALL